MKHPLRSLVGLGLFALLPSALPACGSSSSFGSPGPDGGTGNDGSTGSDGTSQGDGVAPGDGQVSPDGVTPEGGGGFTTVFTIILENTDYMSIVGSANAPYINGLIAQYGLATNYMDSKSHPSLPNYLYMVSGATQYPGIFDVDPTASPFPVAADNLGNQLTVASIPWRSYQESAGSCVLSATGTYAPKHDPFLYFQNIQNDMTGCAKTNVDYTSFAADLAAGTYRYMWITPNLNDDGHDTDLKTADTWCSTAIPAIMNSATYKAGGVLFLTWDEGEGLIGTTDHVPMIIVSPRIKSAGYQSAVAYDHASFLATVETIFGLPKLGAAASAMPMMEFFK